MHLSQLTFTKVIFLLTTFIVGRTTAFLSNARLSSRADLPLDPCQSLDHPTSSRCWDILQVESYLTGWAETTPDCKTADSTGSGCCFHQNETWSTCFLRLATGKTVYEDGNYDSRHSFDCDSLFSGTCSRDILLALDPNLDPTIKAPVAYVKNAIYEIWAFFKAYGDSLSLATTHNAPLDQIFQSFGTSLSQFLTTQNITRVFPVQLVLALPIISGTVSQNISSPSLQRLATLWTDATQRAPLLSQSLYPSIPTAQQTITLTSITAQNASIDPLHILDDTMNSILDPLANVSSFLDFTRMGTFSDPSTDTAARVLNDRYADLNVGVNTFVTGKMMQDNGYFAIPRASAPDGFAPIVDCLNATNTTCVMANGTVFFWSLTTHRLYELQSSSSAPPVATNDLLDQIERLRWANLQLLFDGAYNCTFSGKSGGQNPVVSVTDAPDGTWSTNVGCISQLPMYLDCDADCPAYAARGRNRKINSSACLFGYQPGC